MRRMLFGIAAGLLTIASSAWADGPIVRWDRIEGVMPPNGEPMVIGDAPNQISSTPHLRSAGKGRAMLNLETGFVSFQVEGLVYANTMTSVPIGAAGGSASNPMRVKGTVVCNAGKPATGSWVIDSIDTEEVVLEFGTGSFSGFVVIPPRCLGNPRGIAFLIRNPADHNFLPNAFLAYGAGLTVQ